MSSPYKTVKLNLKSIVSSTDTIDIFNECIIESHKIRILSTMILGAYLRHSIYYRNLYHRYINDLTNNNEIKLIEQKIFKNGVFCSKFIDDCQFPKDDETFSKLVSNIFRIICDDNNCGRKVNQDTEKQSLFIREFCNIYSHTFNFVKCDRRNLSHILAYMNTEIVTSYKNNMMNNYFKMVGKYVDQYFKYHVFRNLFVYDKHGKQHVDNILGKLETNLLNNVEDNLNLFNFLFHDLNDIKTLYPNDPEILKKIIINIKFRYFSKVYGYLTSEICMNNYIKPEIDKIIFDLKHNTDTCNKIFKPFIAHVNDHLSGMEHVNKHLIIYRFSYYLMNPDNLQFINPESEFDIYDPLNNHIVLINEWLSLLLKKFVSDQLPKIKNDIFKFKNTCVPSLGKFVSWFHNNFIPDFDSLNLKKDIENKPLKYLWSYAQMAYDLEKLGLRSFQAFPMTTTFIPGYIRFDTACLIEYFSGRKQILPNGQTKIYCLNHIDLVTDCVWRNIFDMNLSIMKKHGSKYSFRYEFQTDGVGVSLLFIRNDLKGKKNVKSINNKKNVIRYIDDLTENELNDIKQNYKFVYNDPGKSNIMYMMNDEEKRMRYTSTQRINEIQSKTHLKIINKFRTETVVDGQTLAEYDEELSKFRSHTYDPQLFLLYMKTKLSHFVIIGSKYNDLFLRKWSLRVYINKQRSEAKLIENIKVNFGGKVRKKKKNRFKKLGHRKFKKYLNRKKREKDEKKSDQEVDMNNKKMEKICVFTGNWGKNPNLRHFVPTPGRGILRRIAKDPQICFIEINEAYTSKIDHKTSKEIVNKWITVKKPIDPFNVNEMDILDKGEISVKLHRILTRKRTTDNGFECINRDYNAIQNYKKIVDFYFKNNRQRPIEYTDKNNLLCHVNE